MSVNSSGLRVAVVCCVVACSAPALAQHNGNRLVVPSSGRAADTGPARAYPWPVTIGGYQGTINTVMVTLHNLRHGCLVDLDIQLEGPDGTAVPLMSDVGGCAGDATPAPLTFSITGSGPVISGSTPPADLGTYAQSLVGGSDNFPPPAQDNPPAANISSAFHGKSPNGLWKLYVQDDRGTDAGTIDAWTLSFTLERASPTGGGVSLGADVGEGTPYPSAITVAGFNGRIAGMTATVRLTHQRSDDVNLLLAGPASQSVVLMSDTGGVTSMSNLTLVFDDAGSGYLPDSTAISAGTYKPTNYSPSDVWPSPAPTGAISSTFAAFNFRSPNATWSLFGYDDLDFAAGAVASWHLDFVLAPSPYTPLFGLEVPASWNASSPFVWISAEVEDEPFGLITWRNTMLDQSGVARETGSGLFGALVPVGPGSNTVVFTLTNPNGERSNRTTTVDVADYRSYFSEGHTGPFFDLDLALLNPTTGTTPVEVTFLTPTGSLGPKSYNLPAQRRLRIPVEDVAVTDYPSLGNDAVSAVIRSVNAVPIVPERSMFWDANYYGGHGGTAVDGASTVWYFAEGSQGFFDTYVLLANSGTAASTVTVKYLVEGAAPVSLVYSVAPGTRINAFAGEIPALVNRSFGIEVTATQPIIAERAMYFSGGSPRLFEGGHNSAGVTRLSKTWFFAEGATGPYFDTYVLVGNPTGTAATVHFTYRTGEGVVVTDSRDVPAYSRLTVNVEDVDAALANVAVSTALVSSVPVIAERAMYWPGAATQWYEAHNSFGVTETAQTWAVADCREGGPREFETYVLIVNPEDVPAVVRLTFLREAAAPVVKTIEVPANTRRNVTLGVDAPELLDAAGTEYGLLLRTQNFTRIAVERATYWDSGGQNWAGGSNVTATRLP